MNNLKKSFDILLHTKLVWIFSFVVILFDNFLVSAPSTFFEILQYPAWIIVLFLLIVLSVIVIDIVSYGSLIYTIHQAMLDKPVSISEAWAKGKERGFHLLGVFLLWLIVPLLAGLISLSIRDSFTSKIILIPLQQLLTIVSNIFYTPYLVFVLCGVILNNLRAWKATRNGFQITIRKFFRLFLIFLLLGVIKTLINILLLILFDPAALTNNSIVTALLIPSRGGEQTLASIKSILIASSILPFFINPWMIVFFSLEYHTKEANI